jgi:hypothetical protein
MQADMTKLTVAFRNFANAPNNGLGFDKHFLNCELIPLTDKTNYDSLLQHVTYRFRQI